MLIWNDMTKAERAVALARPDDPVDGGVRAAVADIFTAVQERGDDALRDYSRRFDGTDIANLVYAPTGCAKNLDAGARAAIERAAANIRVYHEQQIPQDFEFEVEPGIVCGRRYVPMDRVGLYIPGGSAPLFSTLLMLAIPAQLAGVKDILLASPPGPDGRVNATVEAVADMLGLDAIMPVGGAQAVAAMALGTETIKPVAKIFGPGNIWVTEAKTYAAARPGGPAIDMPAGPSEVLVIADEAADADFVASDLLSQAEHDPLAQAILLSPSRTFLERVETALQQQLPLLSRQSILTQSQTNLRLIKTANLAEAMDISNEYAPEHLIMNVADSRALLSKVANAGSVFLGPWSTESAGDYASGTNHVLPTAGAARAYSGVGVDAFMKSISVQEISADGLRSLGPVISQLAQMEGLDAHAASVDIRLQRLTAEGGVS